VVGPLVVVTVEEEGVVVIDPSDSTDPETLSRYCSPRPRWRTPRISSGRGLFSSMLPSPMEFSEIRLTSDGPTDLSGAQVSFCNELDAFDHPSEGYD
jgi:hypothetical protein